MRRLGKELVIAAADAFLTRGLMGKLLELRVAAARDILLDRIGTGDVSIEDAAQQDAALSMMYKYNSVSLEGAAQENLRMMASMLAGRLQIRPVRAGDYLIWADTIKSLLPSELLFLAILWRCYQQPLPVPIVDKDPDKDRRELAHRELFGPGKLCGDVREFEMIGAGLMGKGLVTLVSLIGPHNSFRPTARLDRLVREAELLEIASELAANHD